MNRCPRNGYLVGAEAELPTDPTELDVPRLPTIGCSQLRCTRCKVPVRNAPGLSFKTKEDVPPARLAALYDTADLSSSDLLVKSDPKHRLYLCRCSRWLETDATALLDPDPDPLTSPSMPWLCGGHPVLELPHEIAGTNVTTDAELRSLAERGFRGITPARVRTSERRRAEWLTRLFVRLTPTRAPVIAAAAIYSLEHPDPLTRARALQFFDDVRSGEAETKLLSLLGGSRRLIQGIPDELTRVSVDKTLEQTVFRVLAPYLPDSSRGREAFRDEALRGRGSRAVYDGLSKYDSEWLIEHVEDVAKADPAHAEELMTSFLQTPDDVDARPLRERVKRAIGSLS